ncbi:MAG TPA: hypothetical protein VES58_10075 [Syntrophobacteria bacterium]|nr:hypothetical protein [Syntrophobacteria bacterium]
MTAFADLRDLGYPVVAWSQSRPVGPIEIAVSELRETIGRFSPWASAGILLICHSRGGLVARKYLETPEPRVRLLLTLSSPHHGTRLARWATYVSPLASFLDACIERAAKRETRTALQRILGFLGSDGLKELLPGSSFFAGLRDGAQHGTRYVSLGGTSPDLLRFNGKSLSEVMTRFVPGQSLPIEVRAGEGDGLVSRASAVIPFANRHYDFSVNHAAVLFDHEVRRTIIAEVQTLSL